jgi:hypothetical protein
MRPPLPISSPGSAWLRPLAAVAAFLAGLLASSCDLDSAAPPQDVAWSAEVLPLLSGDPENQPEFTANVAMVAASGETTIAVAIDGAPAGATFGWSVRSGTCAGSGNPLDPDSDAFPVLIADELGQDNALIALDRRINVSADYAAEIYDDPAASGDLFGCANLVRLN